MSRSGFVRLVTRIYSPEAGAAPLRLRGAARALAASGATVEVVTTTIPPGVEAIGDDDGVVVRRARVLRDKDGYVRGYASYLSFDLPAFIRQLWGPRPAAVLVEPPPTTAALTRVATALTGVPYVAFAPDLWSEAAASFAPVPVVSALRRIEAFGFRGAHTVIAVSDDIARAARRLGARRVEVIPNGIDTSVFSATGPTPTPQRRAQIGLGDARYLVYTGTASEWQGAGIFVEALAAVADRVDYHLVYLGKGSEWEAIGARARELGVADRVHMVGTVPPDEAAAWLRGADAAMVSLRSGVGYDFAYPTKVLAALACGTPVLYAGPGPAREDIMEQRLGWACPDDVEATAAALTNVRAPDGPQRARLRRWVEENRSLEASSARVAAIVRRAARRGR